MPHQPPGLCGLTTTYKNAIGTLGRATSGCCHYGPQVVPDGVLFFLPSYGAMDTLTARWQVCTSLQAHHWVPIPTAKLVMQQLQSIPCAALLHLE
jgi:hypothetical protein